MQKDDVYTVMMSMIEELLWTVGNYRDLQLQHSNSCETNSAWEGSYPQDQIIFFPKQPDCGAL